MDPLTAPQIATALAVLPGWHHDGGALVRTYRFASFRDAMSFMQDCIEPIERLNHHPEWTNVYDRLTIRLSTHDAGNRVTANDVALAKTIAHLAEHAGATGA